MNKNYVQPKLETYSSMFGLDESVMEIEIGRLRNFGGHPFRVEDDKAMRDLAESIKTSGQLVPIIVRPKGTEYEILSGHRRKRACELAGKKTIKAISRKLDDDEATILMVDSNMQRENILPSEKAYAYKMKYDAINHQGQRNDLTSVHREPKLSKTTDSESKTTINRYIRLTHLITQLLDMVDKNELGFLQAVQLSYLTEKEQKLLFSILGDTKLSNEQAASLRQLSEQKQYTKEKVEDVLCPKKKPLPVPSFTLKNIYDYFPAGYSKQQISDVIHSLLEKWRNEQQCGLQDNSYQQ